MNQVAQPSRIALAFPELRCLFGGDVFVPNIAVFRWERIPHLPFRQTANPFDLPGLGDCNPLARPEPFKCAQQGTELGWLVDVTDEGILTID
ncbi:MAG: hypothetical protein Q6L50_09665 [Gloeomargarita sp. GMQP_bins_120]